MCYNSSPVHEELLPNGFKIEIWHDSDSLNPVKDYDLPGMYAYFDGIHLVDSNTTNRDNKEQFAAMIRAERFPLVITFQHGRYQHMRASRVNWYDVEPNDVGRITGFYVMNKQTITAEWGTKHTKVDGKWYSPTQMAERYAMAQLKVIGQYYDGEVYGFKVINPKGEEIDACWSYIGDFDGYVLEEAKSSAEQAAKKAAEDKAAKKAKKAEAKQFVQMFFHL